MEGMMTMTTEGMMIGMMIGIEGMKDRLTN
jgi:hypothetical protein